MDVDLVCVKTSMNDDVGVYLHVAIYLISICIHFDRCGGDFDKCGVATKAVFCYCDVMRGYAQL